MTRPAYEVIGIIHGVDMKYCQTQCVKGLPKFVRV